MELIWVGVAAVPGFLLWREWRTLKRLRRAVRAHPSFMDSAHGQSGFIAGYIWAGTQSTDSILRQVDATSTYINQTRHVSAYDYGMLDGLTTAYEERTDR